MNQSIFTQYQDDQHYSPSQISNIPNKNTSPVRSRQQLYTNRLEGKVKELKLQIHKNKPLLQQIKTQRKFLKKISDKQRIKIEQTNIPLIRSEYQNEICKLQKEKIYLQEIISLIHEQSNMKISDFIEAKQSLKHNKFELQKMLGNIREQNQKYKGIITLKEKTTNDLEVGLQSLKKQLEVKQKIKSKYNEIMSIINQTEQKNKDPLNTQISISKCKFIDNGNQLIKEQKQKSQEHGKPQ